MNKYYIKRPHSQRDEATTVLVAPRSKAGGVYVFCETLLTEYPNWIVFRRGRADNQGAILTTLTTLFDVMRFTWTIRKMDKPTTVIINTSLSLVGLIREGLFVVLTYGCCRVVLFVHGFEVEATRWKFLLNWGYFRASTIAVLSEDFAVKLREGGFKGDIHVSRNPVSPTLVDQLVKYEKIPAAFLFMSRLELSKGVMDAISIFESIANDIPKATLTIAGSGGAEAVVRSLVSKSRYGSRISIVGYVSGNEKVRLLGQSEFFLLPTHHAEGLPIALLEAMAAAAVVVTRPVAGIGDLWHDIDFGLCKEDLCTEAVRRQLTVLAHSSTKTTIGQRNRQFILKNCLPKTIVSTLFEQVN